jgi:glycosyltransferase involved in cell wall biosynthesis
MRLASAPWIAFLDADDQWHPDKLACQLRAARDGVRFISCDWIRSDDFVAVPDPIPVSRLSYRDLLVMNQFQTSTVVMRTDLARALGGFDPAVDGAEDWDFWLRAAQYTDIVKVDWPLVQYRDVATGYSKNVWRVYQTMQPMLLKHQNQHVLSQKEYVTIETWHHLRFWVAFVLARDWAHARTAWQNAWITPHRQQLLRASRQFLIPFLWKRFRRRAGFSAR